MRHYGEKVIMKADQTSSMPVNEIMKEVDANEEIDYAKDKFKDRANLVDKLTRINIKKIQLLASAMKRYCGRNHPSERHKNKQRCFIR